VRGMALTKAVGAIAFISLINQYIQSIDSVWGSVVSLARGQSTGQRRCLDMSNVPKVIDSPNGALTEMQDRFVDAYVSNGGRIEKAAIEAGYSETSARTIGSRLVKDSRILQEIYRRTVEQVALAAPKALATVERLAVTARSEKVQLEAAADLLNRAGVKAPDRIDHRVGGEISVVIDLGGNN